MGVSSFLHCGEWSLGPFCLLSVGLSVIQFSAASDHFRIENSILYLVIFIKNPGSCSNQRPPLSGLFDMNHVRFTSLHLADNHQDNNCVKQFL